MLAQDQDSCHIELTDAREKHGVYLVKPGITGLAQINNIDMSSPAELSILDSKMIKSFSMIKYFKYIVLTLLGLEWAIKSKTSDINKKLNSNFITFFF